MLEMFIEVCYEEETDSKTDKGNLLESFAKKFLETQGLTVTQQVRKAGAEVDLSCKDNATGETIFVECKAYRNNKISADVISKLIGNVEVHEYSSGWLISASDLGKDAKGVQEDWEKKPEEKRRRLRIYSPETLIKRLISANLIVSPESLNVPVEQDMRSGQAYLLITKRGEFWAIPTLDKQTKIQAAAMLFEASTGHSVSSHELTSWLSQTDTTLKNFSFTLDVHKKQNSEKILEELQNIVSVPMADDWADYRPARPVDFIGREAILGKIFGFFDKVREEKTSTRLIALKAPSGWGKSSSILKIVDKSKNKFNKSKNFVHSIDSRAALTRRFPEFSLVSAIKAAIACGFIPKIDELSFGSAGHFFSTQGMKTVLETLSKTNRVICVFFDQFEELLYKEELVDIFEEMRRLCTAVEEAKANVVIGFSWKTDGTIPTEHRAYHLWHDLADRRLEVDLTPFSKKEVSQAIRRFEKELGQKVTPQLRRLLQEHCQGFPWLLKKLCIHIMELTRSGIDQNDVFSGNLNIATLFKNDIEKLTSAELSCIKQISKESPAEFFKITQTYGNSVVSLLINKRLIIRSGTKLTIYWDIFRDYILTERIPYIPVTYIPKTNYTVSRRALGHLKDQNQVFYEDLSNRMGINDGSTDNLVRDLVNIGYVEASRKNGVLKPLFKNQQGALDIEFSFWRSHEVIRRLSSDIGYETCFSEDEFFKVFLAMHERHGFSQRTLSMYSNRILKWLIDIGLVGIDGKVLQLFDLTKRPDTKQKITFSHSRARPGIFLPAASPEKTITAYKFMGKEEIVRSDFEALYKKNPVSDLLRLGLATAQKNRLFLTQDIGDAESTVKNAASETITIRTSIEFLKKNPDLSGKELGKKVGEKLGMKWADASHTRYGNSLRKWTKWILSPESLFGDGRD